MTEHDYRAALLWLEGRFPTDPGQPPSHADAAKEALRTALKRQEAEEALERGEAIGVPICVVLAEDGYYGVSSDDDWAFALECAGLDLEDKPCTRARVRAIVPLPKVREIDADVE